MAPKASRRSLASVGTSPPASAARPGPAGSACPSGRSPGRRGPAGGCGRGCAGPRARSRPVPARWPYPVRRPERRRSPQSRRRRAGCARSGRSGAAGRARRLHGRQLAEVEVAVAPAPPPLGGEAAHLQRAEEQHDDRGDQHRHAQRRGDVGKGVTEVEGGAITPALRSPRRRRSMPAPDEGDKEGRHTRSPSTAHRGPRAGAAQSRRAGGELGSLAVGGADYEPLTSSPVLDCRLRAGSPPAARRARPSLGGRSVAARAIVADSCRTGGDPPTSWSASAGLDASAVSSRAAAHVVAAPPVALWFGFRPWPRTTRPPPGVLPCSAPSAG